MGFRKHNPTSNMLTGSPVIDYPCATVLVKNLDCNRQVEISWRKICRAKQNGINRLTGAVDHLVFKDVWQIGNVNKICIRYMDNWEKHKICGRMYYCTQIFTWYSLFKRRCTIFGCFKEQNTVTHTTSKQKCESVVQLNFLYIFFTSRMACPRLGFLFQHRPQYKKDM